MNQQKRLFWIRVIAVLAIIFSSLLIYEHFKTTSSEFCNIGNKLDCGVVNKSPYSNIDGVFYFLNIDLGFPVPLIDFPLPVSVLGFLTFLFILISSYKLNSKKKFLKLNKSQLIKTLKILLILSILFSLYLLYIEKFILLMYCIYCIILDVLILIETILVFKLKW